MPSALIVGDSHVDTWSPFGSKLEKKLKKAGYTVQREGLGGSSSRVWAKGNPCKIKGRCLKVADLPKGADLLLICLGTNDGANASAAKAKPEKAAADVSQNIQKLAATLAAKRTVWVLPPWQRGNHKHYTQPAMEPIYAAAPQAGVELFDSRPSTEKLVKGGSGDGIHPTGTSAEAWAEAIVQHVAGGATSGGGAVTIQPPKAASLGLPLLIVAVGVTAFTLYRTFRKG
jgi:lysophospholipase L1-like esterase